MVANDALTRKDAEMGRLTREKVERLRLTLKLLTDYDNSVNEDEVDALCDQALSLESVREEALGICDKLITQFGEQAKTLTGADMLTASNYCNAVITCKHAIIRALQSPARVAEGDVIEAAWIRARSLTAGIYGGLSRLLDSYVKPCPEKCNHANCPLLHDLYK